MKHFAFEVDLQTERLRQRPLAILRNLDIDAKDPIEDSDRVTML